MEEMRRGILSCAKTKTLFSGRRKRKMWRASRRHEEGPYSCVALQSGSTLNKRVLKKLHKCPLS